MDGSSFDRLARIVATPRSRRTASALLGAAAAWPVLGIPLASAKKKKKKATLCFNGQTVTASSKKKKKLLKQGATPGACGPCGCGANQLCEDGACRACDVTCAGDASACGVALSQRLAQGGTIYVCPGRYRGNFSVGPATVVGAGMGEDPATSTLLEAPGAGRVLDISAGATVELRGLRLLGGKLPMSGGLVNNGGGIRAVQGSLKVTGCAIVGNEANNGGGIYSLGTLQMTASTVSGNTAQVGAGLALYGAPGSTSTTISGSRITGNQCGNIGGGIANDEADLTVLDTEISGNTAQYGGGLRNYDAVVTFNAGSRITGNTATVSGGGGAINNAVGNVTLGGATVSGNTSPQCVNVAGCP